MHVLWPTDTVVELWGIRAKCPYGYYEETKERVAIFLEERKAVAYVKAALLKKPGKHGAFKAGTVLRGYDGYDYESVEGVPVDPEI
tara:strand:- start:782 stop:1039 length:258 start_codon:yes stop_codon:yes gene_type:complete